MMSWATYTPISGPKGRAEAASGPSLCKNRGMRLVLLGFTLTLIFAAPQTGAAQDKLYKWVDENGVTHYGDHVPPQYAKSRTEVLNAQGVTVGVREAEKTPEQLAEDIRLRQLEEERLAAEAARRAYDRALIDSYASVDDIRDMRKRRLAAVEGQIIFTNGNINRIKNRMASVEAEIQRLSERQRSKGIKNPSIPVRLTKELDDARSALAEYEENLEAYYLDQARIRIKYSEDIERYKVLRGLIDQEQIADSG